MKKAGLTDLLIFIVTAELVGAVSALISGDFRNFYSQLIRPPLSPPAPVFPVVWAVLYALMGISAYLVYISHSTGGNRETALKVYIVQLAVNFMWSILFFRFRLLFISALTSIVLALLVWTMIRSFRKVSKISAFLNIPYLLWSIFASYLATGTYLLNRK